MSRSNDAPIFTSMVKDLQRARSDAELRAASLDRLLRDVEALHEPDASGDCPTCMTEAPCVTFQLLHQDLTFEHACDSVRGEGTIDLVAIEQPDRPPVPSLAELLALENPALDRAFAKLIGLPSADRPRRTA